MQTQNPKIVFTQTEVEEYHHELLRAEASIRRNIFGARKRRGFVELGKFGMTAAIIFAITFVGMNFGAFEKRAEFLWASLEKTEAMANPATEVAKLKIQNAVSNATEPTTEKFELPAILAEIAPPDNRLIIPKLGIHAPIKTAAGVNLHRQDWAEIENEIQDALRDGVVSFPGTAQPGKKGNAFITGHSSYYPIFPGRYKDVFALLPKIEIGEEIQVWQDQRKFVYRVSEKREVSPSTTDVLNETDDSRLTLMTCTPLGTTLRRLIVTAQLEEV